MNQRFETMGNATVVVFDDNRPVLATDPWLVGTCYFGSWALDHALTEQQIADVTAADYVWISHGHPDHMHEQSLDLFPAGKKFLVPDHYNAEIAEYLRNKGFSVTVLPYCSWFHVSPSVRLICKDNMNQDAILVVAAGDSLIINLNDSPIGGDFRFLRRLLRTYKREKTYLLALCSGAADMFNFVDASGKSLVGPAEERKPGVIRNVARLADRLGVGNFCCSSSQHIYVRADSVWANPYRITWADMQRHWSRPNVRLIEPFVTVDTATGEITQNYPEQRPDERQITDNTGDDDWAARMSEPEWDKVEAFIRKFELVRQHMDFVEFTIGGETRRFELNLPGGQPTARRGICFTVPRQSMLSTTESGYLDDLLIGNFMKVRLINTTLYPRFTPLVAKVGGNAKVYTRQQYRGFLWRYFARDPLGTLAYLFETEKAYAIVPVLRRVAERTGIKKPLKYLYRSMLGDPVGHKDTP